MLTQKSMNINGEYIEKIIDGYTTTDVTGRKMLDVEQTTIDIGRTDGSKYVDKKYMGRTLTVSFVIEGGESYILFEKLDKLNRILDVENSTIIFRDEPDRYYIGTRNGKPSVTMTLGVIIGSFEIYCADPFKYSVMEYEVEQQEVEVTGDDGNTSKQKLFVVDYKGNYKTYPKLIAEIYSENETSEDGESETPLTGAGDCGFVAFYNNEGKIIQIGDPDEADGEDLAKNQTLVNQSFKASTAWGTATKNLWPYNKGITSSDSITQVGSMKSVLSPLTLATTSKEYYLTPDSYGTGSKWHGPSITRTIPADASGVVGAKNWQLTYVHKMAIGDGTNAQKEQGAFQVLLVSGSGNNRKIVAGVNIYKGSNGTKTSIRFYLNNKTHATYQMDLSHHNVYLGVNRGASPSKNLAAIATKKTCVIKKTGKKVSFNIGGYTREWTVNDDDFANMEVTEVTFTFSQFATRPPLSHNGIYLVKFHKNNCETWKEVPNKFAMGDVVMADCRTGDILHNDLSAPELGALGNDWEDFCLKPGVNQLSTAYSEWLEEAYAPKFKLRYREVFL